MLKVAQVLGIGSRGGAHSQQNVLPSADGGGGFLDTGPWERTNESIFLLLYECLKVVEGRNVRDTYTRSGWNPRIGIWRVCRRLGIMMVDRLEGRRAY